MKNNTVGTLKDGTLNRYGFFCGYMDREECFGYRIKMFLYSSVFAIQIFKGDAPYEIWNDLINPTYRAWFSFEKYAHAKQVYRDLRNNLLKHKGKDIDEIVKRIKEQGNA